MNNLRNLRKKKGLSLKELHRITGYPLRSLEDWDMEKRQITAYHRIKRLSEVLECSVDELMVKEEKCLYKGNICVVALFQEEDGVHIEIFDDDNFYAVASAIIPREKALELLKKIKKKEDIAQYFEENA